MKHDVKIIVRTSVCTIESRQEREIVRPCKRSNCKSLYRGMESLMCVVLLTSDSQGWQFKGLTRYLSCYCGYHVADRQETMILATDIWTH